MDALSKAIEALRQELDVTILGHHYEQQGIIDHCDFCGDSLELSRKVSEITAKNIVFCGVYFMAESAALLKRQEQSVFIPDKNADCAMALMSPAVVLETVLTRLKASGRKIIPLAYVNTMLDLKAVVGRHGGSVCTSSNAEVMLRWALHEGDGVLFVPDKNLAQNTAKKIGLKKEDIAILEISKGGSALDPKTLAKYTLLCWPGMCPIHDRFTLNHVKAARAADPNCKIVVHPECSPEVVNAVDAAGSTAFIIKYVHEAPAGSHIVVGTEINLVERLKEQETSRLRVDPLMVSSCPDMAKITPQKLLHTLQQIQNGKAEAVSVSEQDAAPAKLTLEKMLDICTKA